MRVGRGEWELREQNLPCNGGETHAVMAMRIAIAMRVVGETGTLGFHVVLTHRAELGQTSKDATICPSTLLDPILSAISRTRSAKKGLKGGRS